MEPTVKRRHPKGEALAYFKVHVRDVTDACMIWPYPPAGDERRGWYGRLWIDGHHQPVTVLTCELHYGPRSAGMLACHGPCHNTLCWNWQHLYWGSLSANALDRHRDGTGWNRGDQAPNRKLTEAQAIEIIRRRASGERTSDLAREFAVSTTAVNKLASGRIRPYLPRP